jgi:transposase InsO family protein
MQNRTSSPSTAASATNPSTRTGFTSSAHAQAVVETWRREYNEERPTKGLGGLTPAAYATALMNKTGTVTAGL